MCTTVCKALSGGALACSCACTVHAWKLPGRGCRPKLTGDAVLGSFKLVACLTRESGGAVGCGAGGWTTPTVCELRRRALRQGMT
eukprot:1944268-Rhodomonas_salina.1